MRPIRNNRVFGGEPVLGIAKESDRRAFLRMAGLVGVGATLVAGGLGSGIASAATKVAMATGDKGDLDILNYALTLEYLESDFYATGLKKNLVSARELELITEIADHESAHVTSVTALIKQLGGTPVEKPTIKYPDDTFASKANFLKAASTFEEVGVTAYHGQVGLIKSGDVLGAAASIAGVESRHAAVLATLIGGNAFPSPIEKQRTKEEVLAIVKPYIS
ncbi:ferritin-like domain-containing protein [Amycolatopsis sp. H20-H5]|uniref:ferritin-like domain-containing protein n=1 Tax=Amycolatopsis sp. H20-H5 TaxID=3046309 RepID=UPI002DBBC026|nr:ferritin-like domain-containing protein [Amycolatopsis sp. H20-H5]MEC3980380.1 ferritin-like domain-containing protein [Amycolatopsis sp. H20-H5]